MRNDLKTRLKKGEGVLGTMITVFDNPEIVKIVKVCGFDFFVIDCEHGGFDYSAVANMLALSREAGIPGIIRIPEVKREVVLKYMEMGSGGLLLPNTDTAEQAKLLVDYAKYYPMGNRGVSLLRPHTGFEPVGSAVQYMQALNAETVLMAQIESPTAVENVEAILAVDGIDAVFVGPNDLSQSMGIMGQTDHPDFIAAVDHVIEAAREKGKYSGIHLMSSSALKPWIDKGMSLNLWGNEIVFMMNSAKPGVTEIKKV
jgi:2-dehydro-3-deoxyglucarate aldolase/4-hydroxy-2-oxoheptanedioate aldolase